jgi:hypothetical protein
MTVKDDIQNGRDHTRKLDEVLKPLFMAWIKNKLVPIHLMLQKPELPRAPERIQTAIRTIYELCGHFCYDDDYEHYFFHLISLFEKFHDLTKKEVEQGFEDLKAILQLFCADSQIRRGE